MLIIDPPTSEGASASPSVTAFVTAANGTAVLNDFAGIGINGNNARNLWSCTFRGCWRRIR